MFSGKYELPPVNKENFKTLLQLSTCSVVMLTHDGYYRQRDSLVIGIPSVPPLANDWLYSFDGKIGDNAKLYERYVDDIIQSI